jgi:HEAT repeat protein
MAPARLQSTALLLAVSVQVGAVTLHSHPAGGADCAPGAINNANSPLADAIDKLGDLDYTTRMKAAQTVRRTPVGQAVPALVQAVSEHRDGYVRFRALVLLAGFDDPRGRDVMAQVLSDPNDRLRTVAYNYFEHNPDPKILPALLKAVDREEAEFVRPGLIRALAAQSAEPRVKEILLRDAVRGQDFFRSAVIEALGTHRVQYAIPVLTKIAQQDGPLVIDAAVALGRIGNTRSVGVLADLQGTAPKDAQPAIAAAICLLGVNCGPHEDYIADVLRFAEHNNGGFQPLLRTAASSLAALASSGKPEALQTLLEIGIPSPDPTRAPLALALGTVAIRNPPFLLKQLEQFDARDGAIALLQEGFDMLEEDFEKERFFVTVRRTYWQAPDGSPTRNLTDALIQKLEF